MRLRTARVQDYRCVTDSQEFVLDDVTCLVGKNESGKTTILSALSKLNPPDARSVRFRPTDYPRNRWSPGKAIPSDPRPISTEWELSAKEVSMLEADFGTGFLKSTLFTWSKCYSNTTYLGIRFDEKKVVAHELASNSLDQTEIASLKGSASIEALKAGIEAQATRSPALEAMRVKLAAKYKSEAEAAVRAAVYALRPTVLYFDQYQSLPGQIAVSALLARIESDNITPQDQIFIALLAQAGTTVEELNSLTTFEAFRASMRAVSNQTSNTIFKYWTQNKHLKVVMTLDAAREADPAPFNSGTIFRTRIDNERHGADTSFDDRSTGFVWFFSFLIWFQQLSSEYGNNLLILLDEPGLSLHARAQSDLLRYINTELKPNYQVIYSTHSPFMIDPDNLPSARTVEDVVKIGKKGEADEVLGTKVSSAIFSSDEDTVSPLQRALDYEITQTLFVGRHTLLVEGPSDILYLKWFSQYLDHSQKAGLDYRWTICVVKGVTRIPPFVSVFRGNGLQVAAIIDVHAGEKQRIKNATEALADRHLFELTSFTDTQEADIEDMVGRDLYAAIVNSAYNLSGSFALPKKRPSGAPPRAVDEAEKHFKTLPPQYPEFDHYAPAQWLFQTSAAQSLPGLDAAAERFRKLFEAVNAILQAA